MRISAKINYLSLAVRIIPNNAITDGDVAPLTIPLTMVIIYYKIHLIISKNAKDSKEG